MLALVGLALAAVTQTPFAHAAPDKTQRGASGVHALGQAYRAFEAQEYDKAYAIAKTIDAKRLENADYAVYVRAQSAYLLGDHRRALKGFRYLARSSGSRFRSIAGWRAADCQWRLGQKKSAQRAYRKLLATFGDHKKPPGDLALARFRIAVALERAKQRKQAIAGFRELLLVHPAHPLARDAERHLRDLGGAKAARLTPSDRIARAQKLTRAHRWKQSIAELSLIDDNVPAGVRLERDFWTATTLFKMRRRYKDASDIFLRIYKQMGGRAAKSLFHGARALSRADFDKQAITWYQRVVKEYPRSLWAKEAQFLSGWLAFNLGDYEAALPHLRKMLRTYPKSRWATDARWFLAFSLYRLGRYQQAFDELKPLTAKSDRLTGGKAMYWQARSLQQLARKQPARDGYKAVIERYPFSWYAHLARARLTQVGVSVGAFGEPADRKPAASRRVPAIDKVVDESLASDPLIRRSDELMRAGLDVEAGYELRRGEKAFIKRAKKRSAAYAMLMDRYRKANNFNRPWMMAVVYGGKRALNGPPIGQARVWWEHAYPLAYRPLIERYREQGKNPPYYLYTIMRKESGYNPHVLSYANAIGLLQMIPATTKRVVEHLNIDYTEDLLYDPELNIQTASWYIGRLLHKFDQQIPLGSGSYNSGPRPVMRWLDKFGDLPMDEFVETVPYRQTREYMKKITETYSRYLYLYEGIVYDQPLVVDREYQRNELTY